MLLESPANNAVNQVVQAYGEHKGKVILQSIFESIGYASDLMELLIPVRGLKLAIHNRQKDQVTTLLMGSMEDIDTIGLSLDARAAGASIIDAIYPTVVHEVAHVATQQYGDRSGGWNRDYKNWSTFDRLAFEGIAMLAEQVVFGQYVASEKTAASPNTPHIKTKLAQLVEQKALGEVPDRRTYRGLLFGLDGNILNGYEIGYYIANLIFDQGRTLNEVIRTPAEDFFQAARDDL